MPDAEFASSSAEYPRQYGVSVSAISVVSIGTSRPCFRIVATSPGNSCFTRSGATWPPFRTARSMPSKPSSDAVCAIRRLARTKDASKRSRLSILPGRFVFWAVAVGAMDPLNSAAPAYNSRSPRNCFVNHSNLHSPPLRVPAQCAARVSVTYSPSARPAPPEIPGRWEPSGAAVCARIRENSPHADRSHGRIPAPIS